ncbi:ATP-dependent zinc protease [Candidatus Saccharibacteria bacterium]|nr:ATP-dependent zinc protease [Candidatus Saccharibacteria bacterium]
MVIDKNQPDSPGIIGSTEYVSVGKSGIYKNIPAKIDTGADSSSIWASNIEITPEGILKFVLFDEGSDFYTGKVISRKDYKVAVVRSATGEEQIRYRTHLRLTVAGKTINALFNLSDRSKNNFPILIGRRTISGKFLVDTSIKNVPQPPKNPKTTPLNDELRDNPREFYLKHKK